MLLKKFSKSTIKIYISKKKRQPEKITCNIKYQINTPKAIIVDDQLDTGHTLICVCQDLQKQGVKEIDIMVTHGLFTGKEWSQLFNLGVQTIYTTNTIPQNPNHPQIKILPIEQLLISHIKNNQTLTQKT